MNRVVLDKVALDALNAGRSIVVHNDGPNLADEVIEVSTVAAEEIRNAVSPRSASIRAAEQRVKKLACLLTIKTMTEREKFDLLWRLAHVALLDLEHFRPWRDL